MGLRVSKIYIMHLSLMNVRDLQLKKHHVFSINTTRTSGWCQDEWCIQTRVFKLFQTLFLPTVTQKRKKKLSGHVRLEFVIVAKFDGHELCHLASRLANVIRQGGREGGSTVWLKFAWCHIIYSQIIPILASESVNWNIISCIMGTCD